MSEINYPLALSECEKGAGGGTQSVLVYAYPTSQQTISGGEVKNISLNSFEDVNGEPFDIFAHSYSGVALASYWVQNAELSVIAVNTSNLLTSYTAEMTVKNNSTGDYVASEVASMSIMLFIAQDSDDSDDQ